MAPERLAIKRGDLGAPFLLLFGGRIEMFLDLQPVTVGLEIEKVRPLKGQSDRFWLAVELDPASQIIRQAVRKMRTSPLTR